VAPELPPYAEAVWTAPVPPGRGEAGEGPYLIFRCEGASVSALPE
jgi:hypothetical protein